VDLSFTLVKTPNGLFYLELTEEGNWESFPAFAEKLANQLNASVVEKTESVDTRIWKLKIRGVDVDLVYNDFPNGVTITPCASEDGQIIQDLYEEFCKNYSKDGI